MRTIMKFIKTIFLLCFFFAAVSSCKPSTEETSKEGEATHVHAEGEEHHEEAASTDEVRLTEEQFNTIGIEVGELEDKNLSNTVKANGVLELPPQNIASLSSFIGGVIRKIYVIPGDFVKENQTLATLEHPEVLQIQQDYVKAESELGFLEKEYKRQKELLNENVIAAKKFQQSEADYKSHRGLVQALEGKLKMLGISPASVLDGHFTNTISIKSPISGYVSLISVNTGSSVDPAKEIIRVVDNHHIHVNLQVYEKDIANIKEGQKVFFNVAKYGNQIMEAKIFAVNKEFEGQNRSVSIHAEIKNNQNKNLMPGMYVNGRIQTESETVKALPNDAIVSEGDLRYIFVKIEEEHEDDTTELEGNKEVGEVKLNLIKKDTLQKEDKVCKDEGCADEGCKDGEVLSFKRIEIKVGISDLGYTQIISLKEIPEGAEIVKKGAYYLDAQLKKGGEGMPDACGGH